MDPSRFDGSFMEFAGKRRVAAIAVVALAGVVAAALVWRGAGAADLVGAQAPAALPGIVIEVRNGTSRSGLARQAARLLRERGVDVIFVGTSSARPDSTTVLVRRGSVVGGHELARLLGGARVRSEPDSLLRVDLTVLLGADFRLPKGRLPL